VVTLAAGPTKLNLEHGIAFQAFVLSIHIRRKKNPSAILASVQQGTWHLSRSFKQPTSSGISWQNKWKMPKQ